MGHAGQTKKPMSSERFAAPQWNSHGDSPAGEEAAEEGDLPVEYTWKTPLCECEDQEEAWQIQEVLRQAGIESWIEGPGYSVGPELSSPRIVVAADQLGESSRDHFQADSAGDCRAIQDGYSGLRAAGVPELRRGGPDPGKRRSGQCVALREN